MHGLDDRDAVEEQLARIERALDRMRDLQLALIETRSQLSDQHMKQLARMEVKLNTMGELVICAAALGLGTAVGYGVQHYSTFQGWGWPAATVGGMTFGLFAGFGARISFG